MGLPTDRRAAGRIAGPRRTVQALFDQDEILGPAQIWLYPSIEAEARGWAAAMSGEFAVESTNGRGERSCPSMSDDRQTVRFARSNRGDAEGRIA